MKYLGLLLIVMLLFSAAWSQQPTAQMMGTDVVQIPTAAQISFTYTLPTDSTNVTLGVKDATGALIRTIFAGKQQVAGQYSGIWDGNTDAGAAATGGPFSVVVLYGNPTYTWNGTIGNTSNTWNGAGRWSSFYENLNFAKLTFVNGIGWSTQALSEGTIGLSYFPDQNPNSPNVANPLYFGQNIDFIDIANDGQNLYACSASPWGGSASFCTKFDARTGQPAFFTNGTLTTGGTPGQGAAITYAYPGTTMSDIDTNSSTFTNPPTAVAVQRSGSILAVAHGNYATGGAIVTDSTIKFFDKTTGLAVGSNATITNPSSMAFDPSGNLWVVGSGVLSKIASPSGTNTITTPIAGLSNPVAVDVNQVTGNIYVLDGGSAQQLKVFNSSLVQVASYGTAGGYLDCNPTVTHTRLMLDEGAINGQTTGTYNLTTQSLSYVRVEDNGDVWIADTFDHGGVGSRLQHFTPSGATFTYVNQVMFSSENYALAVSHTQPNRVFAGMMEFTFDYTKPNNPGDPTAPGGNNSWQFTRAWTVGLGNNVCQASNPISANSFLFLSNNIRFPVFLSVEQLSNGHVYGLVAHFTGLTHTTSAIELPLSGTTNMRYIGSVLSGNSRPMDRFGNLVFVTHTGSGAGSSDIVNQQALTGFDGSNNPIWGTATAVATATYNSTNQPSAVDAWGGPSTYEATAGGVYPIMQWAPFNSSATTNFPHLGGILPGRSSSFLFTALPEVCSQYPLLDAYPCSLGTGNLGTGVYSDGHNVLAAYGSQASNWSPMFWHFYDDGMYIGQFGPQFTNGYTPTGANGPSLVTQPVSQLYNAALGWQSSPMTLLGYGQNMGTGRSVLVNGDLWTFVTSEAIETPVQVWRASNLSSIHELSGTGTPGSVVTLSTVVF